MIELTAEGPYDLRGTLFPLYGGAIRRGPTRRLGAGGAWGATRTPLGPASWQVEVLAPGRVGMRAWGPGRDWVLGRAPDLLGLSDTPPPLRPAHASVSRFAKRARGIRLPRSHRVVELLVPTILAQKVSGAEAARAYASLVRRFSDPAPAPLSELWLPPSAEQLRGLPDWATEPLGVLGRHLRVLRRVGALAPRLEEVAAMGLDDAVRRLVSVAGIGPWTAGSVLLNGLGHADALPVGDLHLPSLVAWNLVGEREADDRRMLELLEPYRGMRGRVVRWIAHGGVHPPRRGPRPALRPRPPGWRAAMARPRR
ncbi:MAG: DNA-3-methyladenine glycosylase family protein [Myxococcota bacterium]